MKWLIGIGAVVLGLPLLAALVLWAMTFRSGANHIAGTIEIDRAPEQVWPWIVEGDSLKQWVGWLTEVHELTPGELGVGARRRWVMIDPNMNNQRVEITAEWTAYEPPRLTAVTLDSPPMFRGTASYTLTPLGAARTRVDYVSDYRMHSWFWRLLEPVVTPQAEKKAREDLARMKAKIEGAPVTVIAR